MKGKKFNMAEAGYCEADVYDCQVKAKKIFFEDELPSGFEPVPKENWPPSMLEDWEGTLYDITGFYGQQVVALHSQIVNDREHFTKNKTFYLLIRDSLEDNSQAKFEELFRLQARPFPPDQPGNGIVFLRERGKKRFKRGSGTSYQDLNSDLEYYYDKLDDKGKLMFSDITSFARDMKQLLKNNSQINKFPPPTAESYMILVFGIGRRLVKIEKPSERKKALDELPIGSAIARFINLLELRKSSFKEVFLAKKKFHSFEGEREVRRKAIEEINLSTMNINDPKATRVTEVEEEEGETTRQLQEHQKLFCPDKRSSEKN